MSSGPRATIAPKCWSGNRLCGYRISEIQGAEANLAVRLIPLSFRPMFSWYQRTLPTSKAKVAFLGQVASAAVLESNLTATGYPPSHRVG